MNFEPDYQNIVDACRNIESKRMPLYEHIICNEIMEEKLNKKFTDLSYGDFSDKIEYFKNCADFAIKTGYDTISAEFCLGGIYPGGGALGGHIDPVIKNRDDFEKYPWYELENLFFNAYEENFKALALALPNGMKAIGGVGNGVFESAQELLGFEGLCYVGADDPELYADLFVKIGDTMCAVWNRFLNSEYKDAYCVMRFGDDLGYKNQTMLSVNDIKEHIIPQYKRVIKLIHDKQFPFLFHSCGKIFDVMDDIINISQIDAKHSNEDQIADFTKWVDCYGSKIGNFGGVDTDHLCRKSVKEIEEIVTRVVNYCKSGKGGFALGSGNSIPNYVPYEGYMAMVETGRKLRGDYK